MSKVKVFKNGAYVSFERVPFYGQWIVKVYSPAGALLDKVISYDYRTALEYKRCFEGIAKNA